MQPKTNLADLLTRHPHFWNIILQFVRKSRLKNETKKTIEEVQYLQHIFGLRGTPLPLWKFSENSSVLVSSPVPDYNDEERNIIVSDCWNSSVAARWTCCANTASGVCCPEVLGIPVPWVILIITLT